MRPFLNPAHILTFLLFYIRARDLNRPIHASIAKQTTPMYKTIRDLLTSIAPDLQGLNTHRYRANISGGVQEFMEAVLFQHYLETQRVMRFEDASAALPEGIALGYEDYVLGLFDMIGELMRFAITYMATNGSLPGTAVVPKGSSGGGSSILVDLQALRTELEAIDPSGSYLLSKDFGQKLKTARASTEKVENGVYSMIVRGKERPKGWRPDAEGAPEREREREQIESY